MNVTIDARPLQTGHAVRGVGVLVRNLLMEMGRQDKQDEYTLLSEPNKELPSFFARQQRVSSYRLPRANRFDWIIDQFYIPRVVRTCGSELFFATDFGCYPVPRNGMKVVSIVYDLIPFIFPHMMAAKPAIVRLNLKANFANLRCAHRLLAISEATKSDTVRLLGINPERIQVIYPGIDHALFNPLNAAKRIRDCYGISGDYFLYVGDPEWRKNLRGVLEALAGLPEPVQLVIVGKRAPEDPQLSRWLVETSTAGRALLPGFVPDEDLPGIYGHARGFLFPSRYEGFGLPVAEALACGCPVITARNSSLPEVAGDAALYVDPEQPGEIRQAMENLLRDDALSDALRARGLLQVRRFTWERAARETLAALREVAGE